jgi:hypothetical protein
VELADGLRCMIVVGLLHREVLSAKSMLCLQVALTVAWLLYCMSRCLLLQDWQPKLLTATARTADAAPDPALQMIQEFGLNEVSDLKLLTVDSLDGGGHARYAAWVC